MDILVSGHLTTFAPALINTLIRNGHTVITSCAQGALSGINSKNYIAYSMSIEDDLYPEIFSAHAFDAIIHILERSDFSHSQIVPNAKSTNTTLLEIALHHAKKTRVENFILISSFEIYGLSENLSDQIHPNPATARGQITLNAERLCQFYAQNNLCVSVIRVPRPYGGTPDNYSLLTDLIRQSQTSKVVKIPYPKFAHCNFIHLDDLTALVFSILQIEKDTAFQVFNTGSEDINFHFLSQQLNLHFPKVNYQFKDPTDTTITHRKTTTEKAKRIYGWKPAHDLISDIQSMNASIGDKQKKKKGLLKRFFHHASQLRPFLVWIEVVLGALLMHMLTIWTNTIIEFKVIDYRLIYVVLIGSIHGLLFGLIAAILAAASAILSWNNIGLDFALLIYNVENWIPFTVYFLAGAITGYVHDKKENELAFEKHQTELIHEKYTFLYSLYSEISSIKNRLREQLVGYRDSFGRFFRIANELNEFDADNIFLKALEILEDLMKNNQVAIYSIESTGHFGRLQVSSKSLVNEIPKSMRLDDYEKALPSLLAGDVFQNKDLIANYPAYIAPIMNTDQLIGLVIIWQTNFEQLNLYYYNLFKVITGLIQSSLVRAATFENAQIEKLYITGTRIMQSEPFKKSLAIKKKMRRNKVSDFQILRIVRKEQSWQSLDEKISRGIRNEDIVGVLEDKKNECFILLENAAIENIGMIQERLQNNDIDSEHLSDLEVE